MLDPKTLCDTYTIISEPEFNPNDPFADGFEPDDPFGDAEPELPSEDQGEEAEVGTTYTVLTKVRLSQSSGDRAVDAMGDKDASQAILFFFRGVSRANGELSLPVVKKGDKVVEGVHDSTTTASDEVWTVKGVKPLKARNKVHHLEINLV